MPDAPDILPAVQTVYLDHAATTPMLPAARRGDDGTPARRRQPLLAARQRSGRAADRGGVPRDDRAGDQLPSGRGRLHLRRHRVRQPGAQGAVLVAARRRPARGSGSWRPRSSTTPSSTPCTGSRGEEHAVVELLAVDRHGRLDLGAFRDAVERDPASVALISVMWANNEVGTLQPIEEVVAIASAHGIPVHTDAVQAVGAVPVDFAASGVDALTLTGHKLGGPYGVGALVLRRELSADPAAPRWRPGARHPQRHPRHARHRRVRDRRRARGQGAAGVRRADGRTARRPGPPRDRDRARRPTSTATSTTGSPATPTSASPTARATRC